ncbi:CopC domain-containing protein YobA [Pantoea sp. 1.19]|uniref:CopC domain-containing protein YobA n=1 Tax=Pantoea sp. 1.19 TaxID=1925589 RepID=UPI000948DFFC|nr:CopC domain-containing protein YobA [Pantoea sp. 1.19]
MFGSFPRLRGALLLLAMSGSGQVLAHAHLKDQYPAANASVPASPQALTLTFSEEIEPAFSGVTVSRSDDRPVATGKAQRDAAMRNQLIVPLSQPLPAGDYRVEWHVLSVDGHKTQGDYRFSVK